MSSTSDVRGTNTTVDSTASEKSGGQFNQNMSEFVQVNQKVFFAAADRNKEAIYEQIKPFLSKAKLVAEVGSGSGQHITYFAKDFPQVVFQPTEYDTNLFASIEAYAKEQPQGVFLKPLHLDATNKAHWDQVLHAGQQALLASEEQSTSANNNETPVYDLVLTTNVFHITPWIVTESIVQGAGRLLKPGGHLIVYGPFKRNGQFNTESNRDFDASLRERDPTWGVRDLEEVGAAAEKMGQLRIAEVRNMPANNYLVIFEKF